MGLMKASIAGNVYMFIELLLKVVYLCNGCETNANKEMGIHAIV